MDKILKRHVSDYPFLPSPGVDKDQGHGEMASLKPPEFMAKPGGGLLNFSELSNTDVASKGIK